MRTMRRILGDRTTAGLMAAVVFYGMLLQSLVSAYAQGLMAGPQPGSTFVICSLTGAIPDTEGDAGGAPLERVAHPCCAVLCQAAAFPSLIFPASDPVFAFSAEIGAEVDFTIAAEPTRPDALGLLPQSRAPPHHSI